MEKEKDDLINVVEVVNELDYIAKDKGLEVDCWKLYRTYYNEHLKEHGSNTKYIGTSRYDINMDKRYDCVIEGINCTIEDKLKS